MHVCVCVCGYNLLSHFISIACACWTLHYAKRLLETVFVHRFSHNTMPIRNLFKVCCETFTHITRLTELFFITEL